MRRLDHGRGDLGDFQTPRDLVDAVLHTLGPIASRWTRILEPTCGSGSFLQALLEHKAPPRELIGIEIQEPYWTMARSLAGKHPGSRVDILRANLFDLDLRTGLPWRDRGPLLVVGNPPWITAAALGKLDSGNVPSKRNLKELPGIEARTGSPTSTLPRRSGSSCSRSWPKSSRRSRFCARPRPRVPFSSSPTARGCRSRKPRSTRSTPRAGSAPRWAPACCG